jgi:hypothetical protein
VARISLRWKILTYSGGLLVALIAATLIFVNYQAAQFVDARITQDLEQGRVRIVAAENERLDSLRLIAQLVASYPPFKAALATDQQTVRDFLESYQQEIRNASLLIALDNHGRVIARTDVPEAIPITDAQERWIKPTLEKRTTAGARTGRILP